MMLHYRALAVASSEILGMPFGAPAPAHAAQPPPPYLPHFENTNRVFLPFIGSYESSGEAEAPTTPVGPNAM